jgi:hypothetical protein
LKQSLSLEFLASTRIKLLKNHFSQSEKKLTLPDKNNPHEKIPDYHFSHCWLSPVACYDAQRTL